MRSLSGETLITLASVRSCVMEYGRPDCTVMSSASFSYAKRIVRRTRSPHNLLEGGQEANYGAYEPRGEPGKLDRGFECRFR
jgi:hypothetical protein